MAQTLFDMPWVDLVFLAVLALSVVIGLMRGLLFEVLSLLGWVAAWFAAQYLAPHISRYVPVGTAGGALNQAASFALAFVAALIVWGLVSRLLRMLLRATPLSLFDRLLGGIFGLLRGLVLLLAVATLISFTPASQSPAWRASRGAQLLTQGLQALKPLLPEQASRLLAT